MRASAYRSIQGAAAVNMLLGVGVLLTPFIAMGREASGQAMWSNIMSAVAVMVLAGITMSAASSGRRMAGPPFLNTLIGIWVFGSAFLFDPNQAFFTLNILLGTAIFLVGAFNVFSATARGKARPAD